MVTPQVYIAAAIAASSFAGGWAINGWRLESDLTRCEATVAGMAAQITDQNDAINRVREAGIEAQKQAEKAIETHKAAAATAEARRRAAMGKPAPQSCDAAFDEWDEVKK